MGILSTATTAFSGLRWQALALDAGATGTPAARANTSKHARGNFANLIPHATAPANRSTTPAPNPVAKVAQTTLGSSFTVISGVGFVTAQDVPAPVKMSDPGPQADSVPTPVRMLDPGPQVDSVPTPVRMLDPGPQADVTTWSSLFRQT